MNLTTVHRLRAQGIEAVYGDAGHVETLRHAGVDRAGSLILGASGLHSKEIIRIARCRALCRKSHGRRQNSYFLTR